MGFTVIIPTLRAADTIERLIHCLLEQSVVPDEIFVVDSQSDDGTAQIAAHLPRVRVLEIAQRDFDHGGTRDWALRQSDGDFVIFMTQDALPTDRESVKHLLAPFSDERVAAVGGRQVAWPSARADEKLVREHNYPAQNRTWSAKDIDSLGVRAFLISDVFAAYRKSAYLDIGGFDHPIMTNEDMLIAERLLHAGYFLAYSGEAAVYHSHDMTLSQQFHRNFIVGRTLKRYEQRFEHVQEMGDGVELFSFVLGRLLREGHPLYGARFCADCAARLCGNRLGRWAETRALRREQESLDRS